MNPELTGAAPKAAAPKKKSNVGLIIGIIAGALIIAGGVVAAILLINNANNGGGEEGGNQEIAQDVSEPYKNDKAYFIKIDGKTFTNQSKIKDLGKVGYNYNSRVEDQNVPAGKYMIMIGGGSVSNSDKGTSISITPYNDGKESVKFPEAKLGKVTITTSTLAKAQAEYEKMEVYGGIHLGSTRKDVVKAFGEPTDSHEYEDYKGNKYEKIEYQDKTWKEFEFKIEDGKVTEIVWTNYGELNR
ncbi:hypothetical protein IKQ65_01000 [Candidatus Saccharibacteria bacterium]|nr:hypothetical protein [Candidatus Saccharibacteria bacterium]MBR6961726.1 hypothetical protein [Candidatus Saccharibacteria bacterium]